MSKNHSVLQWNMGHSYYARSAVPLTSEAIDRRCTIIESLIDAHKPTFVALQEAPPQCGPRLKGKLARRYEVIEGQRGKGLVTLYSVDWARRGENYQQRATMLSLEHRINKANIRLWNVHFWSLSRMDRKETHTKVRMFVNEQIRRHRAKSTTQTSEIIVGDFNMCPYEDPISTKDCLWGNQSLHWALARERTISKDPTQKRYRPLFNPSWELLGHHEPPLGTYYYAKNKDVDGPWYVFDQMLMSPRHGLTNERHAEILGKAGETSLWSDDKIRNPDKEVGSDHYPVLVKFRLG